MLESVLYFRIKRSLVEELRGLQLLKSGKQIGIRQLSDFSKERQGHVVANDGGRLQQMLLFRSESINTGGQHGLNGRRNADLFNRHRRSKGSALADECLALDQCANGFFEKNGLPSVRPIKTCLRPWR